MDETWWRATIVACSVSRRGKGAQGNIVRRAGSGADREFGLGALLVWTGMLGGWLESGWYVEKRLNGNVGGEERGTLR
jgi:hypothetical protein